MQIQKGDHRSERGSFITRSQSSTHSSMKVIFFRSSQLETPLSPKTQMPNPPHHHCATDCCYENPRGSIWKRIRRRCWIWISETSMKCCCELYYPGPPAELSDEFRNWPARHMMEYTL